jgi:hypothetical protein
VGPRGLAKQGADADYPRKIAKPIIRQADTIVGYFEHGTVSAFKAHGYDAGSILWERIPRAILKPARDRHEHAAHSALAEQLGGAAGSRRSRSAPKSSAFPPDDPWVRLERPQSVRVALTRRKFRRPMIDGAPAGV